MTVLKRIAKILPVCLLALLAFAGNARAQDQRLSVTGNSVSVMYNYPGPSLQNASQNFIWSITPNSAVMIDRRKA